MLLIIVLFHPLYPESPSGTIPNSSHSNPENHSVNLFQYFQTVAAKPPPTCRPFPLQVFRCTSLLPTLSSSLFPSKPMKNGLVPLFSEPSLGDGNNGARTLRKPLKILLSFSFPIRKHPASGLGRILLKNRRQIVAVVFFKPFARKRLYNPAIGNGLKHGT